MGICASCLGRDRGEARDDEQSGLLSEDPNSINYGAFAEQQANSFQGDPQDVQRENEALQKVVAQTSSHLVDIFALVPQNGPRVSSTTFPGQDARAQQYQDVLAKLPYTNAEPMGKVEEPQKDWLSDDEEDDEEATKIVTPSQPILGGFSSIRG